MFRKNEKKKRTKNLILTVMEKLINSVAQQSHMNSMCLAGWIHLVLSNRKKYVSSILAVEKDTLIRSLLNESLFLKTSLISKTI